MSKEISTVRKLIKPLGQSLKRLDTLSNLSFDHLIVGAQKLTRSGFKRGFEVGLLTDKFAFFEAIFSCKSPIPERRKAACKTPILQVKGLVLNGLFTGLGK